MNWPPEQHNARRQPGVVDKQQHFASPLYPKPETTRARILDALRAGRGLTSLEAWQEFGASRLAADVHELRRMGWPIVTSEIEVACRDGRAAHVAQYRLRGAA